MTKAPKVRPLVESVCKVCGCKFLHENRTRKGTGNSCSKRCAAMLAAKANKARLERIRLGIETTPERVLTYHMVKSEIGAIQRIGSMQRNPRLSRIARCNSCERTFVRPENVRWSAYCAGCSSPDARARRAYVAAYASKEYECRNCGSLYCKIKGTLDNRIVGDWCSDACRDIGIAKAIRKGRRKHRTFRDSHERGNQPGSIAFDPFDVFKRDKWKCKGCGIDTPRRLRGTYEPDAPELDHIIPLSRGGWNAPDNCQTLCRQCNADKGTKLPDEWKGTAPKTMRLF